MGNISSEKQDMSDIVERLDDILNIGTFPERRATIEDAKAEIERLELELAAWRQANDLKAKEIIRWHELYKAESTEVVKLNADNDRLRAVLSEALVDSDVVFMQPWWDRVRRALEDKS